MGGWLNYRRLCRPDYLYAFGVIRLLSFPKLFLSSRGVPAFRPLWASPCCRLWGWLWPLLSWLCWLTFGVGSWHYHCGLPWRKLPRMMIKLFVYGDYGRTPNCVMAAKPFGELPRTIPPLIVKGGNYGDFRITKGSTVRNTCCPIYSLLPSCDAYDHLH